MSGWVLANHFTSAVLVLICWWLAHQNSFRRGPLRRPIAVGYAATGVTLAAIALWRQLGLPYDGLLVTVKITLIYTLGLISARVYLSERRDR